MSTAEIQPIAIRARITEPEYQEIRVAAIKANMSTQDFIAELLRDALEARKA